jgi:hypothetical protein
MNLKADTISRIIGSVLIVVSYFVILHVNVIVGTVLHAFADVISIPYFIRTKGWDVVIMLSFMTCISVSKFAL